MTQEHPLIVSFKPYLRSKDIKHESAPNVIDIPLEPNLARLSVVAKGIRKKILLERAVVHLRNRLRSLEFEPHVAGRERINHSVFLVDRNGERIIPGGPAKELREKAHAIRVEFDKPVRFAEW